MAPLNYLRNKKVLLVVAALGVIAGVVSANQSAIAKQLDAWHLLPQPEPYTAVFFNDSRALPTHAEAQASLTADATIQNMQYEPTTYTYKITANVGGGSEHLLKQGSCTIDHGGICTINGNITVPALGPRIQIRTTTEYIGRTHDDITKRPRTQSLHYWIDVGPSARSAS